MDTTERIPELTLGLWLRAEWDISSFCNHDASDSYWHRGGLSSAQTTASLGTGSPCAETTRANACGVAIFHENGARRKECRRTRWLSAPLQNGPSQPSGPKHCLQLVIPRGWGSGQVVVTPRSRAARATTREPDSMRTSYWSPATTQEEWVAGQCRPCHRACRQCRPCNLAACEGRNFPA